MKSLCLEGHYLSATQIAIDTVVCLETVDGQRQYRIETKHTKYFENERLDPESDLAVLLIGKQQGETFNLQDGIGSKPVSVRWIKPVHLDALHSSLEQFNERFPRTDGLVRFRFDPEAEDPLEDIRAITKARAEASLRILEDIRLRRFHSLSRLHSSEVTRWMPGVAFQQLMSNSKCVEARCLNANRLLGRFTSMVERVVF